MLILSMMLLIGLIAATWGFLMCFLPTRWDILTQVLGGPTPRWMYPGPNGVAPIMRLVTRAAGFVICLGGIWFSYIAASSIYRFLAR
jgi:hypothetical protein